jgi:hypothetical protein
MMKTNNQQLLRTAHQDDTKSEHGPKKVVRICETRMEMADRRSDRRSAARTLRRLKRQKFLQAVGQDPTSSTANSNDNASSSSLREDDDDMPCRVRMVRYNTESSSIIFASSSSIFSELTDAEDLQEINQAIGEGSSDENRRDYD